MTEEQALTITDEEWEAMQRRAHEEEVAEYDQRDAFLAEHADPSRPRRPMPGFGRFHSEPEELWNRWSPNHPESLYEERLRHWEKAHMEETGRVE